MATTIKNNSITIAMTVTEPRCFCTHFTSLLFLYML
nr:MAG TPA: hypothetical protein [Caudoviricetes sp.]